MNKRNIYLRLVVFLVLGMSLSLTSVAQELAHASPAGTEGFSELLNSLPPCDLLDFTSDGVLAQLAKPSKVVSPDWLDLVHQVSPSYYPIPFQKERQAARSPSPFPDNEQDYLAWPQNDRTRHLLVTLSRHLRESGTKITLGELNILADAILARAKIDGRIGECYKISQVSGTWNTEWIKTESLSPDVQRSIDEAFLRVLQPPLTANETSLLQNGRFLPAELAELRALRVATRIFEQNTSLRADKGGFSGNLPGLNTKLRTVCRTEAQTYYFFIRRLQARGLLKHFGPRDTMAYRTMNPFDGHGATLLQSHRTQEFVVLDSWHEDGGNSAHVTLFSDWVRSLDRADIASDH